MTTGFEESNKIYIKAVRVFNAVLISLLIASLTGCGGSKQDISALPQDEKSEISSTQDTSDVPGIQEFVFTTGLVVELNGEPEQVTFGESDNGIGSFHPDGARISFQSNRDGHWQIYELDLAARQESRTFESEANDENPVWSQDGAALLFVSDRDGASEWERDVYAFNTSDELVIRLSNSPGDDWYPVPETDGSFIFLTERDAGTSTPIYQRPNAIYRGYLDGTPAVKLSLNAADPSVPSPLGSGNYILRLPDGSLEIWTEGGATGQKLLPDNFRCGAFIHSPNRNWLLMSAQNRADADPYRLYLLDLGSKIIQEIPTSGREVRFPQFSPDGREIIYSAEVEGRFQLFLQRLSQ